MVTRRDFIKTTALGGTLIATGQMSNARTIIHSATKPDSGFIQDSEKKIPVIKIKYDTDVKISFPVKPCQDDSGGNIRCHQQRKYAKRRANVCAL